MKLFLSSLAISYEQSKPFMDLVGKPKPQDVKIALIENAADVYEEGNKDWMYDHRSSISSHKFKVDLVNLEDYRLGQAKGLLKRLEQSDAIWLGGGNVYYLRWILKETRADIIITTLVKGGKVYGGGSAGAIIAGPTLDGYQPADNPEKAPKLIHAGLRLTDIAVIPHWSNAKYGKIMEQVKKNLERAGLETQEITDEQALIIDGDSTNLIQ